MYVSTRVRSDLRASVGRCDTRAVTPGACPGDVDFRSVRLSGVPGARRQARGRSFGRAQAMSTPGAPGPQAYRDHVDSRAASAPGVPGPCRQPCCRTGERAPATSTLVRSVPHACIGHVDTRAAGLPRVRRPCRHSCGRSPTRAWPCRHSCGRSSTRASAMSTLVRPDPNAFTGPVGIRVAERVSVHGPRRRSGRRVCGCSWPISAAVRSAFRAEGDHVDIRAVGRSRKHEPCRPDGSATPSTQSVRRRDCNPPWSLNLSGTRPSPGSGSPGPRHSARVDPAPQRSPGPPA